MKNLLLIALFCAGQILTAMAQTTPTTSTSTANRTTMSDYERMLQNQQKVEFRTQAVKTLGLTEKQIQGFNPMYDTYMEKKNELAQKRMKLLNNYVEEIAENDSPANEENDKEEFLEDYLELQVKEMELRKDYFDKMEDVITADKAFGFYLMEDMASNNIYLQILEPKFSPFMEGYRTTTPTYDSNGNRINTGNNSNNSSTNPSSSTTIRSTTNPPNSSYNNSNSPTNNSTMDRSNTNPSNSTNNSGNWNSNSTNNSGTNPSNSGNLNPNSTTHDATLYRSGTNPSNTTNDRSTTGNDPMRNDNTTTMPSTTAKSVDNRYRTDIDTYTNWAKTAKADIKGNHHNTQDGLNSLVSAISSLSTACNMATDNTFSSNKNKIVANASELQKDPKSMKHSSMMRESFIMAADMLKTVQQQCAQTSSSNTVAQGAEAARKIDVNKTTYSQEQHIRDFFQKAQVAIDGMAGSMNWSSK